MHQECWIDVVSLLKEHQNSEGGTKRRQIHISVSCGETIILGQERHNIAWRTTVAGCSSKFLGSLMGLLGSLFPATDFRRLGELALCKL